MFSLTYDGDSLKCPHCGTIFGVKWDTEYGDPLVGEHKSECIRCKKEFHFSVYHEYKTW
jgi:DNA-directed RNA polymerase subunit RPC12/RpoP